MEREKVEEPNRNKRHYPAVKDSNIWASNQFEKVNHHSSEGGNLGKTMCRFRTDGSPGKFMNRRIGVSKWWTPL